MLAIARLIFQSSRERRHALQRRLLREELPDFQIGIDTFLNSAKKLEDQLVAVDDRSIALLGADWFGRKGCDRLRSESRIRRRLHAAKFAFLSRDRSPLFN